MSIVTVENNTTLTQCEQLFGEDDTVRTFRATLGDWLVIPTLMEQPIKKRSINRLENLITLLHGSFVIEVQSGNKTRDQSIAQLFLTMAVHIKHGTLKQPAFGCVIAQEADEPFAYISPVKMDGYANLRNGQYAFTAKNLANIVLAKFKNVAWGARLTEKVGL